MHLNKIYILAHIHKFEDGHESKKIIGSFFTKEKALEILDKYKTLEGFKDALEGFYIQEVEIDILDKKKIETINKQ